MIARNIEDIPPGVIVSQDLTKLISEGLLLKDASLGNIESCSYDLRIGTIFRDNKIERTDETISIDAGEIINIYTTEEFDLPANVMAVVYPINEQSSKGLLVLNPGLIDPGYQGPVTIKAINLNRLTLPIRKNMKIFTAIFYVLPVATSSPYSKSTTPRDRKEQEFLGKLIEQKTSNISQIISLESGSPFPTKEEVKSMIRTDWIAWIILVATLVAAITGVASVILAVILAFKK